MEKLTRKIIIILLAVTLLSACVKIERDLDITNKLWTMETIQDAHSGKVIACNERLSSNFQTASILTVTLSANDNFMEIYDVTNDLRFHLDHKLSDTSHSFNVYRLSTDTASGQAIISYTEASSSEKNTVLVVSIGDYVIYFK